MKRRSFTVLALVALAQLPLSQAVPANPDHEAEARAVTNASSPLAAGSRERLEEEMAAFAQELEAELAALVREIHEERRPPEESSGDELNLGFRLRLARLLRSAQALDPPIELALRPRLHALRLQLQILEIVRTTGQVPPARHRAQGEPGGISGTVTAEGTGEPIVGAIVTASNAVGFPIDFTVVDASGHYEIDDLFTGNFRVTTSMSGGFVDERYDNHICISGRCLSNADPVSVEGGTTTPGIDFILAPGGRFSGTVTEAISGNPVDALVCVKHGVDNFFFNLTCGLTDASGHYVTLDGLPSGDYVARTATDAELIEEHYDNIPCTGCTASSSASQGKLIPVTAPNETPGIDFALSPGGRLSGVVTHETTGVPLANVRIEVHNPMLIPAFAPTTDASGHYVTPAKIPTGTYFARTRAPSGLGLLNELYDGFSCVSCDPTNGTPILVDEPEETPNIDFALAKPGVLSGRVTLAGSNSPIGLISVQVYNSQGTVQSIASTAADGTYRVTELLSGMFHVLAVGGPYLAELYDDVPCALAFCTHTDGTLVPVVPDSETTSVDFGLRTGGFFLGQVTDELTGAPLGGVLLRIYDEAGSLVFVALTDAEGHYQGNGPLAEGNYFATVTHAAGYTAELFDNLPCPGGSCDPTMGVPIVVNGSTVAMINFALHPAVPPVGSGFASSVSAGISKAGSGGNVAGRITDLETGALLDRILVLLFDSAGILAGARLTNLFGDYVFPSLSPGSYFALTTNTGDYAAELFDNLSCPNESCDPTTGAPILVEADETTAIDFALRLALVFQDGFESGGTSNWSLVVD